MAQDGWAAHGSYPGPGGELGLVETPIYKATGIDPVAVVAERTLAEAIAGLGPTLVLQPRLNEPVLVSHAVSRLVVDESFVFSSPWYRWIDDGGEAWGPLRHIAEWFRSKHLPVLVLSSDSHTPHLQLRGAQYLPNLHTRRLEEELEYLDPLLELLQHFVRPSTHAEEQRS
ncbi:hypothetical protein [Pedococcus soli]